MTALHRGARIRALLSSASSPDRVGRSVFLIPFLLLSPSLARAEEPVELEGFVSAETVDSTDVLPSLEVEGLFGVNLTPVETPRSVSVLSDEMIQRYGMESTRDFVVAVPGTFTPSNYGVDGGLRIRGEDAEIYFRGFRKLQNSALFPTPIGATERVEVVRGNPSVVHGPSRNAGFLNFVPKSARSDRAQLIQDDFGKVSVTFGSYEKFKTSAEFGAPFEVGGRSASVFVFAEFEDSDSFYEYDYDRSLLFQGAINLELTERLSMEAGFMYFDWEGKNNIGWNRLTPELLANGTYLTGQAPDINGFDGVLGETLSPDDFALAAGNGAQSGGPFQFNSGFNTFLFTAFNTPVETGPPFTATSLPPEDPFNPGLSLWRLENVGETRLDRSKTLVDSIDYIWLENWTGYLDFVYQAANGMTFKNQSFFDTYESENYASYGFSGYFDSSVFENRSSLEFSFEPSEAWVISGTTGVSLRGFDGLGLNAFGQGMQHADRRDLSVGPTPNDRSPNALDGLRSWSLDENSEYTDLGVFLATRIAYDEMLFLDLGVREDFFDAETVANGDFEIGAADVSDEKFAYTASLSAALGSFRPYVTYADTAYLLVDSNGGTFSAANLISGNYLAEAELFEAGIKATLLEGKLYFSLAYYDQENVRADQFGAPIGVSSDGVEFELRYAPTESLSVTASATWVDSKQTNDAFIRVPLSVVNELTGGSIAPEDYYGGVTETTLSSIDMGLTQEVPGDPDYVFSLYGTYRFESGLGFTLGGTYVPEVDAGWFGTTILPDYYLVNATVFYAYEGWTISATIRNLLDEEYFSPQVFWDDLLVLPSEPTTVDVTLSYGW